MKSERRKSSLPYFIALLVLVLTTSQAARANDVVNFTGRIDYIRVHDVGIGYGPPTDYMDGEVIIKLLGNNRRFGFQLRQDEFLPARYGMLEMLMEAFRNDWNVQIAARAIPNTTQYVLHMVWLIRGSL